jgi:nicotinamidase-related amidase
MKDPIALLMPVRSDPTLVPGETALLIVDLNGKDAHPEHGLGRFMREKGMDASEYFDRVKEILPRIKRLWQLCRAKGIPVIHLRVAARTTDSRDMNKGHRLLGPLLGWSPVGSPERAFLKEAEPIEGDIVVDKTSTSVFSSTAIDQLLRNMGVKCLIATGGATDFCVGYSVRDAADRGYRVIVVSDCTSAFTRETNEEALERMDKGMIWVKTLDETLQMLEDSGCS